MPTFGSLFSGVGGFDLGLERAGWACAFQCEIDPFCRRVLARHWPSVLRFDDIRCVQPHDQQSDADHRSRATGHQQAVDLLVGGFPCQDLSVAGKRAGLAGERSGLFWEFLRVARELSPEWLLLENVPGLLSSRGGRDFGTLLKGLEDSGYWWAYRVLDSQHFGVAQRRRRVFIVGHRGGPVPPAVLFEPESRTRHPAPGREAGARVAATPAGRVGATLKQRGRGATDEVMDNLQIADPVTASYAKQADSSNRAKGPVNLLLARPVVGTSYKRHDDDTDTLLAFNHQTGGDMRLGNPEKPSLHAGQTSAIMATLNGGGNSGGFRTEPGEHLLAFYTTQITSPGNYSQPKPGDPSHPLAAGAHPPAIAHTLKAEGADASEDGTGRGVPMIAYAIGSHAGAADGDQTNRSHAGGGPVGMNVSEELAYSLREGRTQAVAQSSVRRLTPTECERLQGFPDGWTCLCGVEPYSTMTCRCTDSARYRAMGNAVTVQVVSWIGGRLRQWL